MAQKSARAFEICILPNSALPLPTPSKGFHNFPTLVARLPPPSPLTIVRSAFCNLQSALYKYAILLLPSAICNLHFAICIFQNHSPFHSHILQSAFCNLHFSKSVPSFIHTFWFLQSAFCNLHFAICILQLSQFRGPGPLLRFWRESAETNRSTSRYSRMTDL